jgi:flagellar protein FlgJ
MTPIAPPLAARPAPVPGSEREKLAAAARQFEAIFVRQLLSAARKADFGAELFGGQALETFKQMQDDRFADLAAQSGALGLARQIEAQMVRLLPPSPKKEG